MKPSTVLTTAALILAGPASAHGPAEWIQRGGYRNIVGELCCGERDCEVVGASYDAAHSGYVVADKRLPPTAWWVAEDRSQPSPDAQYWSCVWNGEIKCFFAPKPSTMLAPPRQARG